MAPCLVLPLGGLVINTSGVLEYWSYGVVGKNHLRRNRVVKMLYALLPNPARPEMKNEN